MASFVPNDLDTSGSREPSFLGFSKGQDADKSTSSLLTGASDVIKMSADTVDSAYKAAITEEATNKIDRERDLLINARLPDAPLPSNTNVPPEVKAQLGRLAQAKEAARAGLMNDSYRDILYDKVARDLRYKYAGYRSYIDDTIQKLTGMNPANRLLEDLRVEANKGATSEDKIYEQYVKDAIHLGIDIPMLVQKNKGQALPLPYIQSLVANAHGEKARREALKSESEIRRSDRQEAVDLGMVRAKEALDQNDVASRSAVLKGVGITPEGITKLAQDYQSNPSSFTSQNEEQLRVQVGAYLQQAELSDRKFLTQVGPDGKSIQTMYGFQKNHIDDLINQKKLEREAFFKPLLDKEFGAFNSRLRVLEASKFSIDERMFANENIAAIASVRRNLGDIVANSILTDKVTGNLGLGQVIKDVDKVVAETMAARAVTGDIRSIAQADAMIRKNTSTTKAGVSAASVNNEVVNKLVDVAVNPKFNPVARINAMEALFHQDNIGFITKIVIKNADGSVDPEKSRAKQIEMYNKLNSEEVRQAVVSASKMNDSVLSNYTSFAINTGIAIGKNTLDTVKQSIIDRDAYAKITFDPQTLKFSAQERELSPEGKKLQEQVSPGGVGQMKFIDLQRARRAADELNNIVRKVEPVLKMTGSKNPAEELRLRFNQFGFNIDSLQYISNSDKLQGRLPSGNSNRSKLGLDDIENLQNELPQTGYTQPTGTSTQTWPSGDAYKGIRDRILETMKLPKNESTQLELDSMFKELDDLMKPPSRLEQFSSPNLKPSK